MYIVNPKLIRAQDTVCLTEDYPDYNVTNDLMGTYTKGHEFLVLERNGDTWFEGSIYTLRDLEGHRNLFDVPYEFLKKIKDFEDE